MQDVDAGSGPLRKDCSARDGFNGNDGGSRRQMSQGVGPSSGLQPLFPTSHDGSRFGMKGNSHAMLRDDLEAFEHGTGGRRRQIAESIAHKAFESSNSTVDQSLQLIDIVLRQ